ncbi:hypothetical protein E3J74_03565 [Candidatus Bathyarchaeota archaeon]|nr:MAG: hypothetical protein E3J74_03565 [Candidatus Bathyarchaeota archaeon]
MTICVAIKCKALTNKEFKPSLLFASDTQESSMYLKRSVTKIRTIFGGEPKKHKAKCGFVVASAGDALVIDEVLFDIENLLRDKVDPDEDPSVSLVVWRKEIGNLAYASYKKYKERNVSNPTFELLLGGADKFSTILYVSSDGKNRILEKFGMIGSGRITGGELLLNEFLKDDMIDLEAAHLAALVVTIVGHIDLSVGGEPDIRICFDRTIWVPKEIAFKEILKASELRWSLLKSVWWKMQEDNTVESKLKKLV